MSVLLVCCVGRPAMNRVAASSLRDTSNIRNIIFFAHSNLQGNELDSFASFVYRVFASLHMPLTMLLLLCFSLPSFTWFLSLFPYFSCHYYPLSSFFLFCFHRGKISPLKVAFEKTNKQYYSISQKGE